MHPKWRTIENGISGILRDLNYFDIKVDEGPISDTEEIGKYGPYIQTKRLDIYNTYAKYMVEFDELEEAERFSKVVQRLPIVDSVLYKFKNRFYCSVYMLP